METTISGIPCQVECTYYNYTKPWRGAIQDCPSDWDYYGGTEIEFEVFDRKGYKAAWLERKLTQEDIERIELELLKDMQPDPDDYPDDGPEPDDW